MIETKRLTLLPLNYQQLNKYVLCNGSLEKELGLVRSLEVIPDELAEALSRTILPSVAEAGDRYRFYTLWTLINRQTKQMVGELCLMGEPDSLGEVMLGYGTYPDHQGKGYMTEAVEGFLHWVFAQEGVLAVTAETFSTNKASMRILEKNGFNLIESELDVWFWMLTKEEHEQSESSGSHYNQFSGRSNRK